jgi:uracil-DNA glycosylase family 4
MSLEIIADKIRQCELCPLHEKRTNAVPGTGSDKTDLMFIGEGPGATEDKEGIPFCGAAGKVLTEMIEMIGYSRNEVFITNVVKCRPPDNRDPLPEEKDKCRPYLEEQIKLINPLLIVLLGRHALNSMIPDVQISQVHGQAKKYKDLIYFPVYHPAATLYKRTLRADLEEDFKKIPYLLKKLRLEQIKEMN